VEDRMEEKKVKGTMLMDYVRLIRANKDKDWNNYIKKEDWDIINSKILMTKWYPLEVYQRCGMAAFKILGRGNLEIARFNGKISGKIMFENIYTMITSDKDTMKGINRFVTIHGSLFNFSTLSFEQVGAKHARIYHNYDPNDPADKPFCHQLMGVFDILIDMTGGRNSRIELNSKQWEGAPATVFDITWN
jgi:hypothetical protein